MESMFQDLRNEINRLVDELLNKERQLEEMRTLLVDKERQLSEARKISVDDTCKGNGADESSISRVYRMLAESLVDMKISVKNEMEGFSLSINHENSGYDFNLKWCEQPDGGEWSYTYSSLGTLENKALDWMKDQDIRFSMRMVRSFFKHISFVIRGYLMK